MNTPSSRVPLREIVRRFATGTLSPIDYVDTFIDTIAAREPVVKAGRETTGISKETTISA